MSNNIEEIEEVLYQALAHPMSRNLLKILSAKQTGVSYTKLINEMSLPTGKLNYHLDQLSGLIEKNEERRYVLTPLGKKAL
jgi:predicted transcriptional regulator